jgi:hypothetical protein
MGDDLQDGNSGIPSFSLREVKARSG